MVSDESEDLKAETKTISEMTDEHTAEGKPSSPVQPKPRGWKIALAMVIGIGAIVFVQSRAPNVDHQLANMKSAVAGLLTFLIVAYQVHRIASNRGSWILVPSLLAGLLGLLVLMFQFDGFSGEMIPQFKLRFAANGPAPRTLRSDNRLPDTDLASNPAAIAIDNSLGFLGSERTGNITPRRFAVPQSSDDIELLWNQGIGAGWSSFSVIQDRAITLEQRETRECLTCYRLLDGELLWMIENEAIHQNPLGGVGPRSTPTIAGDHVYAQGATGTVWCVNWKTGEVVWTADLLKMAGWDQQASEAAISWGRSGSPLVVDELCVVPFGGPAANKESGRSLIAFDAQSGETRWMAGEDQISYASPAVLVLASKRQIVAVNEKTITGHEISDGKVLWQFEWFGKSNGGANCAMVIPAGDDQFLIGKGYGGGSALVEVKRKDDGSMLADSVWESSKLLKTKFTHACVDGDVAYAISNGSLQAVSVADSKQLWVQPRRGRLEQGQLLRVADMLIGQAESGEVVFATADPSSYREELRLAAMQTKTWNIPTIAGRHLLVRNDRECFCFLLPALEERADSEAEQPSADASAEL